MLETTSHHCVLDLYYCVFDISMCAKWLITVQHCISVQEDETKSIISSVRYMYIKYICFYINIKGSMKNKSALKTK